MTISSGFRLKSGACSTGSVGSRYSYSSMQSGLLAFARDASTLLRDDGRAQVEAAAYTVGTVEKTRERVRELTGLELQNCKVLDIGPGQLLRHMRCLAVHNDVVGVDMDVIPQDALDYARMLLRSPLSRIVKTLGRKAIGKDARFNAALAAKLGLSRVPKLPVLRMSATDLGFSDRHFDFVCSYSVFEHIDDPEAALREVCRVLRPGGVAYISVHLFTCHSGSHDLRLMRGSPSAPFWPHLRAEHASSVRPSAFLNRLGYGAWVDLLKQVMPEATLVRESHEEPQLLSALEELRRQGELEEYSDEDLLTVNLVAIWKKPESGERFDVAQL